LGIIDLSIDACAFLKSRKYVSRSTFTIVIPKKVLTLFFRALLYVSSKDNEGLQKCHIDLLKLVMMFHEVDAINVRSALHLIRTIINNIFFQLCSISRLFFTVLHYFCMFFLDAIVKKSNI